MHPALTKIYATAILAGSRTLDTVPELLKSEVTEYLKDKEEQHE